MRPVKLGLALISLALPLLPHAVTAGSLRTEYSVTVRGFPVGSAKLKANFDGSRYTIQFSGGIRGLARLFSDAETSAAAVGELGADRLIPSEYKHLWREDNETESVDMRFSGRKLADVSRDPPEQHPEHYVPLTNADKVDVLDPVSAFVWAVAGGVSPDICSRTLPLMDGKRRFDIDLSFSRMERFATRDRSFRGRAVVCSFRYRPVAGQRIGKTKGDTITGDGVMEVWMAPAGEGLAVPARLQIATRMGRVVMTATRFEVH
jgi:Protein of unknown function (DUF3108)